MFEGNTGSCPLPKKAQSDLCISDAKIMSYLTKNGVDNPAIFSLLWGLEMGNPKNSLFPESLKVTVRSIEEHIQKKKEAYDMTEVKLHRIIIELLQLTYEKQVNDIVNTAVSRKCAIQ